MPVQSLKSSGGGKTKSTKTKVGEAYAKSYKASRNAPKRSAANPARSKAKSASPTPKRRRSR